MLDFCGFCAFCIRSWVAIPKTPDTRVWSLYRLVFLVDPSLLSASLFWYCWCGTYYGDWLCPHFLTHLSLMSPHEAVNALKGRTDFPWPHYLQFLSFFFHLQFLATMALIINTKPSVILLGKKKTGLLGNSNLGHTSYGKNTGQSNRQRRGMLFYKEKEKVGEGWFESKSFGERQEFGVMPVSHG